MRNKKQKHKKREERANKQTKNKKLQKDRRAKHHTTLDLTRNVLERKKRHIIVILIYASW